MDSQLVHLHNTKLNSQLAHYSQLAHLHDTLQIIILTAGTLNNCILTAGALAAGAVGALAFPFPALGHAALAASCKGGNPVKFRDKKRLTYTEKTSIPFSFKLNDI